MSFIYVLVVFGLAQALFLSLALLSKGRTKQPMLFLGLLLLIEVFGLGEQLLYVSGKAGAFSFLVGLSYPLSLLRPVLVYFFARSYFQNGVKPVVSHLMHLLPWLLCSLLFLPLTTSTAAEKELYIESLGTSVWSDNLQGIFFFIILHCIYISYYVLTWRLVRRAGSGAKQLRNGKSNWVSHLVTFFLGFYLFKLALFLLNGFHLLPASYASITVMLISSLTVQAIAWLLFIPFKWPEYSVSGKTSPGETDRMCKVLEGEKAYLDDGLTIKKLASRCGIPAERLSELIRLHYGKSFKETINQFRVNEAKLLIEQELNRRPMNLLAIAMDSGFNNKVTFHRVFKKSTGMAPSLYVKKLRSTA